MTPATGVRLDVWLTRKGHTKSRTQAQTYIDAGWVLVNGQKATKASTQIHPCDHVTLVQDEPYVSRAAHKLLGALQSSGAQPTGRALDAGASTGGFTQVLLEQGCDPVYAVDVGHGQLDPRIRQDPRVVVREGLNLRELNLTHLDNATVDWIVADVSFISLRLILPPLLTVLADNGSALILVKPQFEVGRSALDSHGIVRRSQDRDAAIESIVACATELGRPPTWQGPSTLPGHNGNIEHFVMLGPRPAPSCVV